MTAPPEDVQDELQQASSLGTFSVSLVVSDMAKSLDFYGHLGFSMTGGDGESWAILINGNAVIGLFHDMFEGNILTFNPGWGMTGQPLDSFADVRALRDSFAAAGIEIVDDTTPDTESGPASFSISDPDGNAILIDQHV